MKSWLIQNQLALTRVLAQMLQAPLSALMVMVVIGITLTLPALLYLTMGQVQHMTRNINSTPQINLFLATDTTEQNQKQLESKIQQHSHVQDYRFVSRATAWQEMQQRLNISLGDYLDSNPLPDAYVVTLKDSNPTVAEQTLQEIQKWPGVIHAQLDLEWTKKVHLLLSIVRLALSIVSSLLGIAVLAIIGNSIKLQIMTQKKEIELSYFIGATNRFICRPFVYAGTLYGLGGGLIALLALWGAISIFNYSLTTLTQQDVSHFQLLMPDLVASLNILLTSTTLGWISAYVAAHTALAQSEIR